MEANELRIGNIIYNDKNIVKVTSINIKGVFVGFIFNGMPAEEHHFYKDLAYVPLTEDWLIRFGFVRLNHLGNRHFVLTANESIKIEITISDDVNYASLCLSNDNEDLNIDLGSMEASVYVDLSFVHQIQNLYFSLTGQELTT